jgi:hypothetical protein
LLNLIGTVTVPAAFAAAGADSVVVTSAAGVTAVVSLAVSAALFAPCGNVVPMVECTVTLLSVGAVNESVHVADCPLASDPGIPLMVTAPLLLL